MNSGIDPLDSDTATLIEAYFDRLWPIMRSITGEGVRQTHDILSELVPLERIEIPTGTICHDWKIPQEWVVREAYVITPDGERILDIADNNLHLVNYSIPFRGKISREDLDKHLHSIEGEPDSIPYVTSYYAPIWGFCISHKMRNSLVEGEYEVVIDTDHIDGSMTMSEAVLPGSSSDEVLISTYTCHPSMANNELSGPLASAFLYRHLAALKNRKLTYRFVFIPETVGSIAYLSLRGDRMREKTVAGYVITCVGDRAPFTYKKSQREDSLADRAAAYVLQRQGDGSNRIRDFFPFGSDERNYCSPGYNLPVGVLARSWPGEFSEYHSSRDNRDAISFKSIASAADTLFEFCKVLEVNQVYENLFPFGEPNLGRRNLMETTGAGRTRRDHIDAIKWLLNQASGNNDLLSIAERSGINIDKLDEAACKCLDAKLLKIASK